MWDHLPFCDMCTSAIFCYLQNLSLTCRNLITCYLSFTWSNTNASDAILIISSYLYVFSYLSIYIKYLASFLWSLLIFLSSKIMWSHCALPFFQKRLQNIVCLSRALGICPFSLSFFFKTFLWSICCIRFNRTVSLLSTESWFLLQEWGLVICTVIL